MAHGSLIRSIGKEIFIVDDSEYSRKGVNWVQVGDTCVIPSGCPSVAKALEDLGLKVVEVPIPQLLTYGGGIACATGILDNTPSAGATAGHLRPDQTLADTTAPNGHLPAVIGPEDNSGNTEDSLTIVKKPCRPVDHPNPFGYNEEETQG